jgi:uncharacterized membrane protein
MDITLLYKIGTAVCHQIDGRTLHFNGLSLPVCARDTGTYTAFIFTLIYWTLVNRKLKGGSPPLYALITGSLFIGTLVIDGGTSYLHLRSTTNEIRLITGLLAGAGTGILIIPCISELLYKYTCPESYTGKIQYFFLWILFIIVLFFIIKSENPRLYYPVIFCTMSGIIAMFTIINAAFLCLIPPWHGKQIENIKTFFYFFIPAVLLTVIELYISYTIRTNIPFRFIS